MHNAKQGKLAVDLCFFMGGIYDYDRCRIKNPFGSFKTGDNATTWTRIKARTTCGSYNQYIQNVEKRVGKD
jgi:hypothetical protein